MGRRRLPVAHRAGADAAAGELAQLRAQRPDGRARRGRLEGADRGAAAAARRRAGRRPPACVRAARGNAVAARRRRGRASARSPSARPARRRDLPRSPSRPSSCSPQQCSVGSSERAWPLRSRSSTDTPAGALVSRSIFSWSGIGLAALLAAAATLVFYLGSRARPVAIGGASISIADVAAVGALVAVLVALAVGGTDAESLASSSGTGVVLMLLPGLLALISARRDRPDPAPAASCLRAGGGRPVSFAQARAPLARARFGNCDRRGRLRQRERRAGDLRRHATAPR